MKFIQVSKKLLAHPDIQTKYFDNPDSHTKDLDLHRILKEVLNQQRRQELELYKLTAKDESFYQAFFDTMKRMIDMPNLGEMKWRTSEQVSLPLAKSLNPKDKSQYLPKSTLSSVEERRLVAVACEYAWLGKPYPKALRKTLIC